MLFKVRRRLTRRTTYLIACLAIFGIVFWAWKPGVLMSSYRTPGDIQDFKKEFFQVLARNPFNSTTVESTMSTVQNVNQQRPTTATKKISFLYQSTLVNNQPLKMIYNRAGKCGSRSLIAAFKKISPHRFTIIEADPTLPEFVTQDQKFELTNLLNSTTPPTMYIRHMHMVDFGNDLRWKPLYINMIRDPIDRMVSQYYYLRYGDKDSPQGVVKFTDKDKQQTFDECVLQNRSECLVNSSIAFYLIPYFCGEVEYCRKPCRWALERAKNNLLSQFLAVGYVENLRQFLEVLEKLVPSFFTGLTHAWSEIIDTKAKQTRTEHKAKPSEQVIKIMKQRLSLEYEFYNYVKEQFARLYDDVMKHSSEHHE